jgi:transcriptional regulator with GAF, ATPase, and Fis domain
VLERILVFEGDADLASGDAEGLLREAGDAAEGSSAPEDLALRPSLGRVERRLLVEALRRAGGVRKDAARLLGIDQRNLAYYLHKHGIDPDRAS